MTPVAPNLAQHAQSVQYVLASETAYALNAPRPIFDWSKGSAKKNSGRFTENNLPRLDPVALAAEDVPQPQTDFSAWQPLRQTLPAIGPMTPSEIATKVRLLLDAGTTCKEKVMALIARDARTLDAFEFTRLMIALQERRNDWSESSRYYVFCYQSKSVGSVWLNGEEVYNSIWKNI